MKTVRIKATTYKRKGKLIHRKGYIKKITKDQIQSAKKNVKKARKKWMNMSHRERARAMPGPYKITKKRYRMAFGRNKKR